MFYIIKILPLREVFLIMQPIKNIIFDLGGVLINLNKKACVNRFLELGVYNIEELITHYCQKGTFLDFELGTINTGEFREEIKRSTRNNLNDHDIDDAWKRFLLDIPDQKLDLLLRLKEKYHLFLLSNTNEIHFDQAKKEFLKSGMDAEDIFRKLYLSYEIHLAKPGKEIFEYVIRDAGIKPEETYMIDDASSNIETARLLGFQTYQPKAFEDFTHTFEKMFFS